jgi:hypothetical protein
MIPFSLIRLFLIKEAVGSSETLVNLYQKTALSSTWELGMSLL